MQPETKSFAAKKLWELLGLQPGVGIWFAVWQLSRTSILRGRRQ